MKTKQIKQTKRKDWQRISDIKLFRDAVFSAVIYFTLVEQKKGQRKDYYWHSHKRKKMENR